MKRRRWKPEQKALIVLEGLRLDDLGWHALPPLFGAGSRQTEPYLLEHALERVREPDNLPHVLRPAWTVHSLTDAATLLEGVAVVLPAGAPLEAISPSQPARPAWRRSRRSPHREVVAIVQNGPWPGLGIDAAWSDDLVDRLLASYICKAGCRPQAYGYPCHGHGSLHGRRSAAAGPEGRRRRALSGGAAPGPCRLRPSDRCQPWPRGYPAPALVERAAARGHGARGGGLDAEESVLASAVARSERVVLFQLLVGRRERVAQPDGGDGGWTWIEEKLSPTPQLASAAKSLGPFPLPGSPMCWWWHVAACDASGPPSAPPSIKGRAASPDR